MRGRLHGMVIIAGATMKFLVGGVVFGMKHAARFMWPLGDDGGGGNIINNASIAAHRFAKGK